MASSWISIAGDLFEGPYSTLLYSTLRFKKEQKKECWDGEVMIYIDIDILVLMHIQCYEQTNIRVKRINSPAKRHCKNVSYTKIELC